MVKMHSNGLLYWLSPHRNYFTGQPIEYNYSVLDCKPGYARLSRNDYSVTVHIKALWDHKRGALVQDAFPELSATDREFLITGLNPREQASIFGPEEPCITLPLL